MTLLVVTDVFGERTIVRPTGEQVAAGERPWSMFTLTGGGSLGNALFVPPALATVLDIHTTSRPYADRPPSKLHRVYLDAAPARTPNGETR